MKEKNSDLILNNLPLDILVSIANLLDEKSFYQLIIVNKFFQQFLTSNLFWKAKLLKILPNFLPETATTEQVPWRRNQFSYKKIYEFIILYEPEKNIQKYVGKRKAIHQKVLDQKFSDDLRQKLKDELRNYVLLDRCQGSGQLKGWYKFKRFIQSIIPSWVTQFFIPSYCTLNLTTLQKQDLTFFNKGATEVTRALTYFTIWNEIDKIANREDAQKVEQSLGSYLKFLPEGKLRQRIINCRKLINPSVEKYIEDCKKRYEITPNTFNVKINSTFQKLLIPDDETRKVVLHYEYLKAVDNKLNVQKNALMEEQPEAQMYIGEKGIGFHYKHRRNHHKELRACTDESFENKDNMRYLYEKYSNEIRKLESHNHQTSEEKLEEIKKLDEDTYYKLIASF